MHDFDLIKDYLSFKRNCDCRLSQWAFTFLKFSGTVSMFKAVAVCVWITEMAVWSLLVLVAGCDQWGGHPGLQLQQTPNISLLTANIVSHAWNVLIFPNKLSLHVENWKSSVERFFRASLDLEVRSTGYRVLYWSLTRNITYVC